MAQNVNVKHKERLSGMERFALWITEHVGTMGFFLIIFAWTGLWLLWNVVGPATLRFDTFPAFVLWLFISNMLQLFFLPLIMVGQNLQGRHAEIRAEVDFETNIKAEREIEKIFDDLKKHEELLIKILEKLEK